MIEFITHIKQSGITAFVGYEMPPLVYEPLEYCRHEISSW